MEHYFTNNLNLKSEIKEYKTTFNNLNFIFKTDNGVFSKGGLDFGTKTLLDTVLKLPLKGNILDLGCGYGVIGIVISKLKDVEVTMTDVNLRAIHLAKLNIKENKASNIKVLESDGFSNINEKYDYIISNPPIRVGKEKLYELLNNSLKVLNKNGALIIVIRKEQGAKSFIKDFSLKYRVEVLNKNKGFYIISLKNI